MTPIGNVNHYGPGAPKIVLVHGGPGAPGELNPVCKELANRGIGCIEPMQTARSLEGQIEELKAQIETYCNAPICLLGYSWGAMLALLTAAKYPQLARKVILVSSACFDEESAATIKETRLRRLSSSEREMLEECLRSLNDETGNDALKHAEKLQSLILLSDCYDPVCASEPVSLQTEIYKAVWPQAVELRKSGKLLQRIVAYPGPVVAIHGDYDPHPSSGIKIPLENTLSRFSFIELSHCGHIPWIEQSAAPIFFDFLEREIKSTL